MKHQIFKQRQKYIDFVNKKSMPLWASYVRKQTLRRSFTIIQHFYNSTLCFRQGNDNINNLSLLLEWNFLCEDKHNKYHPTNNNCGLQYNKSDPFSRIILKTMEHFCYRKIIVLWVAGNLEAVTKPWSSSHKYLGKRRELTQAAGEIILAWNIILWYQDLVIPIYIAISMIYDCTTHTRQSLDANNYNTGSKLALQAGVHFS